MAEWDRQEGESAKLFARFERYRSMGPSRTLEAVHRAETGRVTPAPGQWRADYERWRWRQRAESWDAEQTRLSREAEAAELAERRKAWVAQAQAVQGKAVEAILNMDAAALSYRDVLSGLVEGVKLELLARGQPGEIRKQEVAGRLKVEVVEELVDGDADANEVPAHPGADGLPQE